MNERDDSSVGMLAGPWYGHHFHFSIIFEEFVSLFQPTDFKRHFKLNFKHFIRTIRDGQEGAAKSSVGTGSFFWIRAGSCLERLRRRSRKARRSKAIQLDRAWIAFWIVFWIACWIAAGTATLTSTNTAIDKILTSLSLLLTPWLVHFIPRPVHLAQGLKSSHYEKKSFK